MARTRHTFGAPGTLPAEVTSFVGRHQELSVARRTLSEGRLLTLTGVGGVGKTRLAMKMAAEVRRAFPDGVWFVELAALRDPQLVPLTVAHALELRHVSAQPIDDLARFLKERRLLVVLDNCEHLGDAPASLVSTLLAAAPDLRILATSRHLLGVEGERVLAVPPLSTPQEEGDPVRDLTEYESVALFVQRAQAVAPDFQVVEANRHAVAALCRRLDGIPLAIELAAVWLRTLSPAQIVERLADPFRLLTVGRPAAPPRQRTLDTAIRWSYDLCSPGERLLWARLSVFTGGFDLEAAEAVCSGDDIARGDVLNLVAGLVNKSVLVRRDATEHPTSWYQVLEPIRQFGADRLAETERDGEFRFRHRDYYLALAHRYDEEGFGAHQADWFIRLRREHGNLRAALELSLQAPGEAWAAVDIAASIWNYWFAGFLQEGRDYLLRGLRLAAEPDLRRAYGLWAAGYLCMFAADFDTTHAMLAESADLAERFDDPRLRARIDECRGHAAMYQGDLPGAMAYLESGLAGFRAIGDALGEFDTLILLSAATFFLGDPRLEEFSERALELATRHEALSSRAYGLWSVGIARWRTGDLEAAKRALRESIAAFLPLHDLTGISFGVQALSWCLVSQCADEHAARLVGAAQAVWRASGAKVDETAAYAMFDKQAEDRLRKVLGESRFEREFATGAAYSLEDALDLALGRSRSSSSREQVVETPVSEALTPREMQIAELIAQGLSNKEIAGRLVISARTAETHVARVLNKLGLTSRVQVAGRLAAERLR